MNLIPAITRVPTNKITGMWTARNQGPENRWVRARQKPKGRLIRKTKPATTQVPPKSCIFLITLSPHIGKIHLQNKRAALWWRPPPSDYAHLGDYSPPFGAVLNPKGR